MVFANTVNKAKNILANGLLELASGCYIAMGRGSNTWDTQTTVSKTFSANTVTIVPNIANVVVKSNDEVTTYVKNVDYTVNDVQGIITRLTAGSIPAGATVKVTYVVIGKVNLTQTILVDEIGRRKATVQYVVQDNNGTIELDGIKYENSLTPTDLVLCKTKFVTGEGAGENVREVGLFFNTVLNGTDREETLTFANSQISLALGNVRNVVVKDNTDTTTYVEGTDYVLDKTLGKIFRIQGGAISAAQEVNIDYKTDDSQYVAVASVADKGLLLAATNFAVKDRDAQGDWTRTFLINLSE